MTLAFMVFTTASAWADTGNEADGVDYIDANGVLKNTATDGIDGNDSPTVLTGSDFSTTLNDGWYVVTGSDVTYDQGITIDGDVHLILADGASMNISSQNHGINFEGYGRSLTIYGQAQGTGSLTAKRITDNSYYGIFVEGGSVTVNGGNVTAEAPETGIYVNDGVFTVNGGNVTAKGNNGINIYNYGDIALNGGNVTVTNNILFNDGSFTLAGGTITAGYYSVPEGTITIASGWTYTDGSSASLTGSIGKPADGTTYQPAWKGGGTSATDPYVIKTTAGLDLLAKRVNSGEDSYSGKYFQLGADIEYTGTNTYTAIGSQNKPFRGHFDGNNHTISGIRIDKNDYFQGLFGCINGEGDNKAEVKNVILDNAIIEASVGCGGIVGYNEGGIIENCHVNSNVTIQANQNNSFYLGGIAGFNHSGCTINGCTSAAKIRRSGDNGEEYGGIAGRNEGTVSNCLYLASTIEGTKSVGAIVGKNSGTVSNCYFTDSGLNKNAIGTGTAGTNCGPARTLTLGEGITLDATATAYGPLTAYGDFALSYNDGYKTILYSTKGNQVALSYTGTVPDGYVFGGITATAGTLSGNDTDGYTLTMPHFDVTVTATLISTSGTCGKTENDNVTWAVTDEDQNGTYETITISGTGKMADYGSNNQPWVAFRSDITTVVIENGVTYIGANAFYGYSNLSTVSGGSNVTSVGSYVFNATKWLDNLPTGLTYVGHVAYRFKGNGTSVTLDENTTQIAENCFHGSGLASIVIPASVTSIGENAFYNCINLTSATFAEGSLLESIGRCAFYSCKSLTEITIPEEVTFVGEYAFASCDNLKKCTLLGSKVIFEDYVFESFGGEPSLYASLEALSSYHERFQEMHVSESKIVGMLTAKEGEPGEYWTSFCSVYSHEVPSDAKIYKATISGTKLVLTELTNDKVVNCGQTVIMKTTSPAILLPGCTSYGKNDFSGNQLTATFDEVSYPGNAYVLDIREGSGVGLYRLGENEKVGACEAYLQYSGSTACEFFPIPFTFANLQAKLNASSTDAKAPTVITLDRDVVYASSDTKSLEVAQGHHAIIDLNGHTIDRHLSEATSSGEVIKVMNNNSNTNPATLVIRDSQGGGQITGGYTQAGGGGIFVSGKLTLEGGTICGNHANGNGGAVNISGTFTMKGGCITNNSCGSYGSGIYTNGGTIYLQGGTITGNKGSEAIYTDHDLNVIGRYDVSGNTLADGKTEAPDIVLVSKVINIAGAISPVNPATVAFASGGPTLTSGWSTYMSTGDPADCFTTPFASSNIVARIGDELHLGTPEAIYWHGDYAHDGTSEEKAYIITTPEGLEYLATYVNDGNSTNGKYFKLGNDIDMSCISNFTPIGDNSHMFMGVFDGQDYTISGLTINQPDNDYIGLFDKNDGLIQNVIISGASITGQCYVGGIAGKNNETIKNCFVIGTSIIAYDLGGAILGENMNGSLYNNYYHNCTLITQIHDPATTFIGTKNGDYSNHNGAMQVLALIDDADNTNVFADMDGFAKGVYLEGRTLYRDGGWNTLCLPFTINANEIAASPLAGAEIRALSSSSLENGTLTLTFTPATGEGAVTYIEAGKPYIIRWAEAATNIVNPLFRGVTMGTNNRNFTSIDGKVSFKGTYAPITFTEENKSILFLGEENTLYYPQPDLTDPEHPKYPGINAFRAYFHLSDGVGVKAFKLNFGDEVIDRVVEISTSGNDDMSKGAWYDIQGRRFNGKPAKAGIYIYGNRKIVIN